MYTPHIVPFPNPSVMAETVVARKRRRLLQTREEIAETKESLDEAVGIVDRLRAHVRDLEATAKVLEVEVAPARIVEVSGRGVRTPEGFRWCFCQVTVTCTGVYNTPDEDVDPESDEAFEQGYGGVKGIVSKNCKTNYFGYYRQRARGYMAPVSVKNIPQALEVKLDSFMRRWVYDAAVKKAGELTRDRDDTTPPGEREKLHFRLMAELFVPEALFVSDEE